MHNKSCNPLWLYLGGGNTVDKADLLETFLAHSEADLPALIDNLMGHGEGVSNLVHFVLQVHVHVVTETRDLEQKQSSSSEYLTEDLSHDQWNHFK